MIRQCKICNNGFNRKCCSIECSRINKLRLTNKYRQTEKGKYNHMMQMRKHRQTKTFKNNLKKYRLTDKYKEYKKQYQQSDKYKQGLKEFRQTEHYKQYLKDYNKTPSGKLQRLKKDRKKRAKQNSIIELFTAEEFLKKKAATYGFCSCINGKCLSGNSHVGINQLDGDHIYPVAQAHKDFLRTGIKRKYTIDDIQFLCHTCNVKKGDKILVESNPKDLNTHTTNL